MTYYSTKTYDHNEGLKEIKQWLKHTFDHTLCIAEDDPELETFKGLEDLDLVDLRIMPAVGCEKFAEYIYNHVSKIVDEDRKWLESVEVREHGANSAIYKRS
jgi:6-pyruvoyltetrahydropterin/6-carboxytetrahydropterin synthase